MAIENKDTPCSYSYSAVQYPPAPDAKQKRVYLWKVKVFHAKYTFTVKYLYARTATDVWAWVERECKEPHKSVKITRLTRLDKVGGIL
jgi:hypothetical protein